jgi:hypothetical protein
MAKTTIGNSAKKATGKKAEKQGFTPEDSEMRLWKQMHIISEQWQSDLAFFNDELTFFRKLIDKYFIWLIDEKNIQSTRIMVSDLVKFEKRRIEIGVRLRQHLKHLVNLIENPFPHNAQQCKDDHVQLEDLLDSEKIKHLLSTR